MTKLEEILEQAATVCNNTTEEEGGIILHKDGDYLFVKLKNNNTGTDLARVLWTADRYEYAAQVLPLLKEGFKHYASFHTHPMFVPFPSHIDVTQLFPGFSLNFIYSQAKQQVTGWTYELTADKTAAVINNTHFYSTFPLTPQPIDEDTRIGVDLRE